jgi:hypothetical protein
VRTPVGLGDKTKPLCPSKHINKMSWLLKQAGVATILASHIGRKGGVMHMATNLGISLEQTKKLAGWERGSSIAEQVYQALPEPDTIAAAAELKSRQWYYIPRADLKLDDMQIPGMAEMLLDDPWKEAVEQHGRVMRHVSCHHIHRTCLKVHQ